MKRFTITITGEGDTKAAREAAQRFTNSLAAAKHKKEDDLVPTHSVKQAIFNCDNPEDQLDLLHERNEADRKKKLEDAGLDARGAKPQ